MRARVVISGIGAVTALGVGKDELWQSLLAGRSAFRPVSSFDTGSYRVHIGAEIEGFPPAAKPAGNEVVATAFTGLVVSSAGGPAQARAATRPATAAPQRKWRIET